MKNKMDPIPNMQPLERYDDGNIPDVDLPSEEDSARPDETLPDTRPRRNGPGGE